MDVPGYVNPDKLMNANRVCPQILVLDWPLTTQAHKAEQ